MGTAKADGRATEWVGGASLQGIKPSTQYEPRKLPWLPYHVTRPKKEAVQLLLNRQHPLAVSLADDCIGMNQIALCPPFVGIDVFIPAVGARAGPAPSRESLIGCPRLCRGAGP